MSEFKKGPWKVGKFESEKRGYSIYFDSNYLPPSIIAVTNRGNKTDLYNARLIAAAPALYEACKIGLAYVKAVKTGVPRPIIDLEDDIKNIKQALAKAEKG